ncbi:hypothetical protein BVL54_17890 [Bacillus paralicheniformis]|nr:hypothetical protein BVL54_17890 [Bacillus paralicheniformis]
MKKFLILSLALCLGIILGACGSKDTAKKMIPKKNHQQAKIKTLTTKKKMYRKTKTSKGKMSILIKN